MRCRPRCSRIGNGTRPPACHLGESLGPLPPVGTDVRRYDIREGRRGLCDAGPRCSRLGNGTHPPACHPGESRGPLPPVDTDVRRYDIREGGAGCAMQAPVQPAWEQHASTRLSPRRKPGPTATRGLPTFVGMTSGRIGAGNAMQIPVPEPRPQHHT